MSDEKNGQDEGGKVVNLDSFRIPEERLDPSEILEARLFRLLDREGRAVGGMFADDAGATVLVGAPDGAPEAALTVARGFAGVRLRSEGGGFAVALEPSGVAQISAQLNDRETKMIVHQIPSGEVVVVVWLNGRVADVFGYTSDGERMPKAVCNSVIGMAPGGA